MPSLSTTEAIERLAKGVESVKPTALPEIDAELFPERAEAGSPSAADLARHIRGGLAGEEIVDLWNVLYPADHNVWYDEEEDTIHYNEERIDYVEAD